MDKIHEIFKKCQKHFIKFFLERHLGKYIEKNVNLSQVDLDLSKGYGVLEDIRIDAQAVNEDLCEKHKVPVEIVEGSADKICFELNFTNREVSVHFTVEGLKLTLQPKTRLDCATSLIESMYNSMSSSVQLAEDFAKSEYNNLEEVPFTYEGQQIFARIFDAVISRTKVDFVNTTIYLEHIPRNSNVGVGITINIEKIKYSDVSGSDPLKDESPTQTEGFNQEYLAQAFTTKQLNMENITFSTVEFSIGPSLSRAYMPEYSESVLTDSHHEIFYPLDDETDVSHEEQSEDTSESYRHTIMFGKLIGTQELLVRLRQPDILEGPKVSFDIDLSGLTMFLTPRQLYIISELLGSFASADSDDTSSTPPRSRFKEKPMTASDYQKVEQVLQQDIQHHYATAGIQQQHGWSTAYDDESDTEETFLPMNNARSGLYESTLSSMNGSMESSMNSSMTGSVSSPSTTFTQRTNRMDPDLCGEISHFQVRLASLAIVLLHEDIMTLSVEKPTMLIPSSVQQMQTASESFFDVIGEYVLSVYRNKDFEDARKIFEKAGQHSNHLRLFATPIQVEMKTLADLSVSAYLTTAKMELLECLYQEKSDVPQYVPILSFLETAPTEAQPALRIDFRHVKKSRRRKGFHRRGPKTTVSFCLNKCTVELDVTIVDRITAFNPQTISTIDKLQNVGNFATSSVESSLEFKVSSPLVNVLLRFPVPDFRPAHDMSKQPWWRRNVRPDYLLLSLTDFKFLTEFQTYDMCKNYLLVSRALEVFYYETENSPAILIAKTDITTSKNKGSAEELNSDVRLEIRVSPDKKTELSDIGIAGILRPEIDPMMQSVYGAFENQTNKQPGPFSAKKVVHESDTPHPDVKDDADEIILPGDKEEIDEFIKSATDSTKISVDISIPTVSVQLPSKHIFELLYNRINNDLLLWQPSAPKAKPHMYSTLTISALRNMNINTTETFTMCRSGMHYSSDTESDEEESEEEVVHIPNSQQSNLVINLQIGRGIVNLYSLYRDSAGHVVPEHNGEFLLNVSSVNLFIVSGYQGDGDLGYVCVQVNDAQLYHCEMMTSPSQKPFPLDFGTAPAPHLKYTIHKSENGVLVDCKDHGNNREMLTIAVRIQATHETHHVKTARVAVGINKATLKHRMCNEPNSWISQILDFFNVQDYPISGYNAKEVLTEFHLHMWDCAIDYRPLYLPLRSLVTIGTFSMSSQLSALANSSTLRFIFEECDLFISEKGPPQNGQASKMPVNLKRDYVNAIELGIFELSIRTSDKKSGINPYFDLRASNNVLHIRTCADSGRALMQLITYYAGNGDLLPTDDFSSSGSSYSSPRHQCENDLICVDPDDSTTISKTQRQHIHDLIGEAMEETVFVEENTVNSPENGAKMFLFPDERQPLQDIGKPLPQVTSELGDVTQRKSNIQIDTDDEFTFLENEGGPGRFPKDEEVKIKWASIEPMKISDGFFFKPSKRVDLLDTPKNYPAPVMRYTLCEMTIIWHMYGGSDFNTLTDVKKKKSVNFSEHYQDNVTFHNDKLGSVSFKPASPRKFEGHWKSKGGANRDHKVLMELQLSKVRFRHEVYPETSFHSSRQVLLINEVEIRDRLEVSNINKFLYLFTNQERPKQTSAYMVHVRMTHIRLDKQLKSQECGIKISLLPLRLNIDQDSLLFLIDFFSALAGSSAPAEEIPTSKHSTPTHQPPVMSVSGEEDEEKKKERAKKMVDENLMILMESRIEEPEYSETEHQSASTVNESRPIYFRHVIFSPDVPIRIDYQAKRLDMTHGPIAGILMGLAQLNCSEIRLVSIQDRRGYLGFGKLITFLLQEWLSHIKKYQLPGLLGGVGPLHAFMQLFQGIRDLFWLPIEQYQKDGRIVRGLQRGANSFTTSTAAAALELTSRLIYLIQITAETAYDMLSPGPSVRRLVHKPKGRKKKYSHPQDIREGVTNAYILLKEGIGETASNIAQVASHQHEQKGYSGALGGVIREMPCTMLRPIIIASAATGNVVSGMRSQLIPDARTEANQKWRCDDT